MALPATLSRTFADCYARLERIADRLPDSSLHFIRSLPSFRVRLGKYRVFLLAHATAPLDQHGLVQLDTSLQRLLDQRRQENTTLKETLSRQDGDLGHVDFRLNADIRGLREDVARLAAENRRLTNRCSPPSVSGRAGISTSAIDALKIQGTGATRIQKVMSDVEKAASDCRLIQMQINAIESQIAVMDPAHRPTQIGREETGRQWNR